MKKLILLLLSIHIAYYVFPQSSPILIGATNRGGANNSGTIFRYTGSGPLTGLSLPPNQFHYEGPDYIGLTQAPNGKLYGVNFVKSIYEYDYINNIYQDKALLSTSTGNAGYGGMLLANNGLFYAVMSSYGPGTNNSGTLISYNLDSNTITVLTAFPSGSLPQTTPIQASNGKLYFFTQAYPASLYEYNISTHDTAILHVFVSAPTGNLLEAGPDTLYGTTTSEGVNNGGRLFRYIISTGTYSILHTFPNASNPYSALIRASDGKIYGMTSDVGSGRYGSLFSYTPTDSTFLTLHNFGIDSLDGIQPLGGVIQASDGLLYGATAGGGVYRKGTLFKYNISTSTYSKIADFDSINGSYPQSGHLTEYIPPVSAITSQPLSSSVCAGAQASFSASDGSLNSTVQWQSSINGGVTFSNIAGATDTAYSFTATTLQNEYQFRAIFTHGTNTDTTEVATLTVYPIASSSISQFICQGDSYSFGGHNLTATGTYSDTLISSSGCDSVITLHLTASTDTIIAHFTLQPAATPHLWYIVNQSVGAGLIYTWHWGDGTTSTGDTPSHIYSTSGDYNVCVDATDSIGCTSTYCDSNAHLYKNQSDMVYVNVVSQIPTGVRMIDQDEMQISYYGGAFHFSQAIGTPARLELYDVSGRKVMAQSAFTGDQWQCDTTIASGVYILQVENNTYHWARKVLIMQ